MRARGGGRVSKREALLFRNTKRRKRETYSDNVKSWVLVKKDSRVVKVKDDKESLFFPFQCLSTVQDTHTHTHFSATL